MRTGTQSPADPAPAARRVELPAAAASIAALRQAAREFALEAGAEKAVAADVALAVTEAATNAFLHAFVDREPGRITLVCEAGQGQLRYSIADDGRGMQPRPDSPGLGVGLSTIGALALRLDLRQGRDGTGTEVDLTFAAPGVLAGGPAERTSRDAALLDRVSRIAHTAAWPRTGVEQVVELLAGELGDAATLSLVQQGTVRRFAAHVHGDPELTQWLAGRPPPAMPGTATWSAARRAEPRLVVHDPSTPRPPGGVGERLGLDWWFAVPLTDPAGLPIGVLGVGGRASRPVPVEREQALLIEVAQRIAGGLANARVLEDLRATRARLERILGRLAEGVVISDPGGQVVYANAAAARLLGAGSPQALRALAPAEVAARWDGRGPALRRTTMRLEDPGGGLTVSFLTAGGADGPGGRPPA
jgi:anti-sigma regulatory factor (Ser/Thr protein kinase)